MKTVLYAEDSEDDVFFLQRALRKSQRLARLKVVKNGAEAISYLAGEQGYQDRSAHPLPDLVLLDISMPITNGFDVLHWLRSCPTYRDVPVFMLSSSNYVADRERAAELGASGFLVKPGQPDGLPELLHVCQQYLD